MISKYYVTWQSHITGEIVTYLYDDADLIKNIRDIILGDDELVSILPVYMPEPMLD